MMIVRMLLTVCCLVLTAAGCATTRLSDVWKDPAYKGNGVTTVLVVAVTDKEDTRQLFEKRFAAELTGVGASAVVSSDLLPQMDKLDKEDIQRAALKGRCDGVIITHLVGIENQEVYEPPVYDRSMYNTDYTFGYYYASAYDYVVFPGAVRERTLVRLETNLYDSASEKLLWRASSKTIDPTSVGSAIQDITATLVDSLMKSAVLSPTR